MTDASTKSDQPETKRDRSRRLFIQPMLDLGWRKPGNVKADKHAEMLVSLADHLAYLSDESFARLREVMRTKGAGNLRDMWPPLARILSYAELVEPRDLTQLPAMLRWFRSSAGQRAEAENRLVEEYGFWCRNKRPPLHDGEFRQICEKAEANQSRASLITDRIRRGVSVPGADHDWMRRYQDRLYQLRELVKEGAA